MSKTDRKSQTITSPCPVRPQRPYFLVALTPVRRLVHLRQTFVRRSQRHNEASAIIMCSQRRLYLAVGCIDEIRAGDRPAGGRDLAVAAAVVAAVATAPPAHCA